MRKDIGIGTLANGMNVYIQYDPSISGHLWGIGIKVGSFYDPTGQKGMAHLAEHVMCAESIKFSNETTDLIFEKYTDGPEGNINIRTDRVSTFFGPADNLRYKRYMHVVFDLFASMLKDRIITPENLATEKAAIHNEYFLYGEDDMFSVLYNLIHKALYKKNPAMYQIDGTMIDVERATLRHVKKFVDTYYIPSNMFLTILGPKFHEGMRIAQTFFGDWNPKSRKTIIEPNWDIYRDDIIPELTLIQSCEITRTGIGQHHIAIAFPTEGYVSQDAEMLDVLVRILAHRIKRRLRDRNLDFNKGAYRALGYAERTFLHGILYLWFATIDAEFAKFGEQIILEECGKLKEELLSKDELQIFVDSLYNQHMSALKTSPYEVTELIIASACNGDENLEWLHQKANRFRKITRVRLRNAANKYLTDNYARAIIRPA